MTTPERRAQPRLKLLLKAAYRMKGQLGPETEVEVDNLSAAGLCLLGGAKLVAGDQLDVTLTLAASPMPLKLQAEVVWTCDVAELGKYPAGLKIVKYQGTSRERLAAFVARFLPPPGGSAPTPPAG